MRRAIWMALAFMGTAPLVALAQQNTGTAPAASPSGAGSIDRGQDTTATQGPGSPGQQSAGSVGTAQGQPATGGAGAQGTTGQDGQQGLSGGTGTGGGAGAGTGGGGTTGPTYRGTTEETPSASPPADIGTRVGPEPGEQAGGGGTGTVGTGGGGTGGTGTGTGGTGTGTGSGGDVGTGTGGGGSGAGTGGTGTGSVGGGGTGGGASMGGAGGGGAAGGGGGQSAMQQAPAAMGSEAMQRELTTLRQRVARLEAEVGALRGTGGTGTGGAGGTATATPGIDTGTPGPDPEDMRPQGPVTIATAVFDGRVVDVTRKHIDIIDTSDGTFYRLTLDDQTRAFVGPDLKRISVGQISEGTQVRTSFALISGVEHARNIVTQPRQQQQGSPQGKQGQAPRSQPPRRAPQR